MARPETPAPMMATRVGGVDWLLLSAVVLLSVDEVTLLADALYGATLTSDFFFLAMVDVESCLEKMGRVI